MNVDMNFDDFTETNYRTLIKLAKKKYKFIFYDDIEREDDFVLWRHDVDMSMHRAYALAKIEYDENVVSTYFIQLSSYHYNLFEEEIRELVNKILKLNHRIGLHFDPTLYTINSNEDFEKYLTFEKKTLEMLFDINVSSFSFHNPLEEHLNLGTEKISGMINTYSSFLKNNVEYCSDSSGYWRHKRLEDFLQKGYQNIQVLTHPEWWQKKVMSPRERVHRCINKRAQGYLLKYDEGSKRLGRLNI